MGCSMTLVFGGAIATLIYARGDLSSLPGWAKIAGPIAAVLLLALPIVLDLRGGMASGLSGAPPDDAAPDPPDGN